MDVGGVQSPREEAESGRTEVRFAAAASERLAICRVNIFCEMCETALPGRGRADDD
jgi:hypothetical protein